MIQRTVRMYMAKRSLQAVREAFNMVRSCIVLCFVFFVHVVPGSVLTHALRARCRSPPQTRPLSADGVGVALQVQKRRAFPMAMTSQERRQQYEQLDTGKRGHVTIGDLRRALEATGLRATDERLGTLVHFLQRPAEDRLDYNVWTRHGARLGAGRAGRGGGATGGGHDVERWAF